VKRLLRTLPLVIEIDGRIIDRAASLVLSHPALATRDLIHAAVTIEHGLEGIISADRGFDQIPGVRRFDPREM
jgi:predicted nucleic acid-binding protein